MAWRCVEARQESLQSMADVSLQMLSSPTFETRIRVPAVFHKHGVDLLFLGRTCFPDALAFVQRVAVSGRRGCIKGVSGSGKASLLTALAAALLARHPTLLSFMDDGNTNITPVYLSGCFNTFLDGFKFGLGVAVGGTAAEELVHIRRDEALLQWIQNRPEKFCFMIDDWDWVKKRPDDLKLVQDVTKGRALVYCSCTERRDQHDECFMLPAGFDQLEAKLFLEHGKMDMADYLLPWTGYVPRFLTIHRRGDDILKYIQGNYLVRLIDQFIFWLNRNPERWKETLDTLAGAAAVDLSPAVLAQSEKFVYINEEGGAACVCDAMRFHACLRSIQWSSMDMEEVLQAWLNPLLQQEPDAGVLEAPWNCTLAVASVLRLRESVTLPGVGVLQVPRCIKGLKGWCNPWFESVYLDSTPLAWPVVSFGLYGKAVVLQAGILEDLDPLKNYHKKRCFLRRVSDACLSCTSCDVYFVWIGCFGKRVRHGVTIQYDDHADVFINYGDMDPLLAPLEAKFQIGQERSRQCYYMFGENKCHKLAMPNHILCRQHVFSSVSQRASSEAGQFD